MSAILLPETVRPAAEPPASPTRIRFGYWLPVFGGWLRNVDDERMDASWGYTRRLAQRSEALGFDLTLIAELFLNDIKGADAPALDAWSTAAALAAVTSTLEIMVAVRPQFHPPALLAKQAANIDQISGGRLALNVVSAWWADEARRYGVHFDTHDDRYARTAEWLEVVSGAWREPRLTHRGRYYDVDDLIVEPKPARRPRPTIYAGGESEAAKQLIAARCDAYVMHGDPVAHVAQKVADMRRRREQVSGRVGEDGEAHPREQVSGRVGEDGEAHPREQVSAHPMEYGMAAYVIVRDSEQAAKRELARITNVSAGTPGYHNYQDWLANTQLESRVSLEDYSVSNRGLRAGLVGTPEQVADRIREFRAAGVGLLLLQCSPQLEEMERFAETVMPLVE